MISTILGTAHLLFNEKEKVGTLISAIETELVILFHVSGLLSHIIPDFIGLRLNVAHDIETELMQSVSIVTFMPYGFICHYLPKAI
jgi:hypothetical protein